MPENMDIIKEESKKTQVDCVDKAIGTMLLVLFLIIIVIWYFGSVI